MNLLLFLAVALFTFSLVPLWHSAVAASWMSRAYFMRQAFTLMMMSAGIALIVGLVG